MFRKSIIAIAAVATIAAVALPSAASAKGKGGHHHHFRSFAVIGTGLAVSSCYKYRWVETRKGLRKVLVNVCNYY